MKSNKIVVYLFTVLFLLCFADISSALPIYNETLYDIDINDFKYKGSEDYKLKLSGKTTYQAIDEKSGESFFEWEFEFEAEDGNLKSEWKVEIELDKKFKEKGSFIDFELTTTGNGFFELTGMFIADMTNKLLYNESGTPLYLTGEFEYNSPVSRPRFIVTNNMNPATEPETMLLLGIGLIGLAGLGRKNLLKRK